MYIPMTNILYMQIHQSLVLVQVDRKMCDFEVKIPMYGMQNQYIQVSPILIDSIL